MLLLTGCSEATATASGSATGESNLRIFKLHGSVFGHCHQTSKLTCSEACMRLHWQRSRQGAVAVMLVRSQSLVAWTYRLAKAGTVRPQCGGAFVASLCAGPALPTCLGFTRVCYLGL